jgi:hypothetical protein
LRREGIGHARRRKPEKLERSSPADLNVAPNPANFVSEMFDFPAKLVDGPVEAFVDVLLRDLLFGLLQKPLCA